RGDISFATCRRAVLHRGDHFLRLQAHPLCPRHLAPLCPWWQHLPLLRRPALRASRSHLSAYRRHSHFRQWPCWLVTFCLEGRSWPGFLANRSFPLFTFSKKMVMLNWGNG